MPSDFDYKLTHNLTVCRQGNQFHYYVDNLYLTSRTFNIGNSWVAIITEDAVARFANVRYRVNNTGDPIKVVWVTRKAEFFNINGQTYRPIAATRVPQAEYSRVKETLIVII